MPSLPSWNHVTSSRLFRALFVGLLAVAPAATRGDDSPPPQSKPERIALWNGQAPVGDGKTEQADAWITVHLPAPASTTDVKPDGGKPAAPRRSAIVICPGGGYGGLVTGAEGHGIAQWLNKHGIVGVVLEYRLPAGRSEVPLLDAQRALRTVRSRHEAWKVDPHRVGIMGFSAGGHLASTAATHFDDGQPDSSNLVQRQPSRPDFAILVYPVITMDASTHGGSKRNLLGANPSPELVERFSNEKQVTARTPPTFLAHAVDDKPVPPENSRAFYAALQREKVPSRYLELASGGHGLNGYKGPMWEAWQRESLAWLESLAQPAQP